MAGGFSFPPPPPPPPKIASGLDEGYSQYGSQQSGRGGRGRGQGRGRGNQDFRGRGNANMMPLGANAQSRGGGHRSYDSLDPRPTRHHPDQNSAPPSRDQSGFPPGAHINPNFTGQNRQPTGTLFSYNANPNLNDSSTYAHPNVNAGQIRSRSGSFTGNGELSRTHAGHKRKLEVLRGPQDPRERKPDPPAAPSVPTFGAPILPVPTSHRGSRTGGTRGPLPQSNVPTTSGKSIGLTPRDNDMEPDEMSGSGEEDNDMDEEAQYAELGTKLTFEHNGEVLSLNNEADLAMWREERRKKFPTSTRVAERDDERRLIGAERKRLLAAVALIHRPPRPRALETRGKDSMSDRKASETTSTHEARLGTTGSEATLPTEQAALHPVTSSAKDSLSAVDGRANRNRDGAVATTQSPQEGKGLSNTLETKPQGLPGINMEDTDEEDTTMDDAAGVEPAPSLSSSDSSSSESDDDEPPEESSTKQTEVPSSHPQRPICRYFAASGRCRDGDNCRFRHELSSKAPMATTQTQYQPPKTPYDRFAPKLDQPTDTGRKSIHERLLEQEQFAEDLLTLQAIKALGEAGFFKASKAGGS